MVNRARIASIPLQSHSSHNQPDCEGIALFLEIPPQSGLVDCGLIGLCISNFHRRVKSMRRIASQHSIPKSCNTACHCNPKIPLQSHMNFEGFCSSPRHYFFNFPITFGNPEILLQSVWIAKNENWIATGLRNIKTSNFGCFDCASPLWFKPCLNTHYPVDCSIVLLCIGIEATDTIRL